MKISHMKCSNSTYFDFTCGIFTCGIICEIDFAYENFTCEIHFTYENFTCEIVCEISVRVEKPKNVQIHVVI